VIGYTATAKPLFEKAGIADDLDEGVIKLARLMQRFDEFAHGWAGFG
jgi:hypothetical protein